MTKIYFASPLFNTMERTFNHIVVEKIRDVYGQQVQLYLPQENAALNDKSGFASSQMIADGDNAYLEDADLLIAILDGTAMDAGVAAEIGYFYSMDKPILALYSDIRQGAQGNQQKLDALEEVAENQFAYVNLYVVGLVKNRGRVVSDVPQLIEGINSYLKEENHG